MTTVEWITRRLPGLAELTPAEFEVVRNFPIMCAIFEAVALDKDGRPPIIKARVREWSDHNVLDASLFATPLEHFRARYYRDGAFTQNFDDLYSDGRNPDPTVVRVLSGTEDGAVEQIQTVLLVVNRYRNNYLHGSKVETGLANQVVNLRMGNRALASAIETDEAYRVRV